MLILGGWKSELEATEAELEATKAAKKQFTTLVYLFSMLFVLVATSNHPEPDGLNSAPVRKAHYPFTQKYYLAPQMLANYVWSLLSPP